MIEGDIYYIGSRLREIDPDYFLVRRGAKIEVHNRGQRGGTYALTVPFDTLDARTVEWVRRTRAERAADFLREQARENAAAERARLSRLTAKTAHAVERALSAL